MNMKSNADLEKLRLHLANRLTELAKENPNLLITLNSNNYIDIDIDIDNVIFDYDSNDYKEFSKTLANVLKYIDFTNVSFTGFKATGVNFTGYHNVTINPQTIAYKDLSNSVLKGVKFASRTYAEDIFKDVLLVNTNFTGSVGAQIIPETVKNLAGGKMASVTFFSKNNGEMFKGCDLSYMDFTGSYGAIVNPQVIYKKSLINTNLTDALLVRGASFDDCYVTGTTFSGQDISLNPQTLRNKTIEHCHFNGVEFIGDDEMFKDIRILDNDFTGSKNAIIDVNAIAGNYIEGNNFADTTILNLLNGKRSSLPSQTKHLKLEGASIVVQNQEEQEAIQNLYGLSSNTKFVSQKDNDEAYLNRVVDELLESYLTRKLTK